MFKYCVLLFLALGLFPMKNTLVAQNTDLLRLEYLRIPENNTGISTSRYRALINLPLKLGKEDYLVVGGEYNEFDVGFNTEVPFDVDMLQRLHIIDVNLGYITKWNENWRFVGILTPRLASNLAGSIQSDDFFFNATASLWKEARDVDKPFRLIIGLSFNSTTGIPIPLPLFSYYKRFHPKWSYTLGIPKSSIRLHASSKQTLQFDLSLDGYFINIQDDIALANGEIGSRISLSALVANLRYQYKLTEHLSFYATFGRSLFLQGSLRDDARNDVFLLNNEASLFIRSGIRFSIF